VLVFSQLMQMVAYNLWGGDRMKFDQVRREFKRTLWGEELDNERYSNTYKHPFELEFLHQYEGKKYRCIYCAYEYEEKQIVMTTDGSSCLKCFHQLFGSDGPDT
jgi:hypothetical protein